MQSVTLFLNVSFHLPQLPSLAVPMTLGPFPMVIQVSGVGGSPLCLQPLVVGVGVRGETAV